MVSAPTTGTPALFRSDLRPRCGAGPRQVRTVVVLVGGVLAIAGIGFVLAGAWPVVGFFGLEVGLLYAALSFYRRRGPEAETLSLTESELTITRTDRRGRTRAWSFQPYWLRVSLVESGPHRGLIELCSHGRSVFVGSFLGEGERRRLVADLIRVLAPLSGIAQTARPRREATDPPCSPCAPCRPAPV